MGRDDGYAEYRAQVPNDLEGTDTEALRDLAHDIPNFGYKRHPIEDIDRGSLIRNLRRFRNGGIPIECHRCSYRWVYNSDSVTHAQCPSKGCATSTGVKDPDGQLLRDRYSLRD